MGEMLMKQATFHAEEAQYVQDPNGVVGIAFATSIFQASCAMGDMYVRCTTKWHRMS